MWFLSIIPWMSRLSSLNSASISLIFASIVSKISGRYNWLKPGFWGVGWAVSSGRHTLELELSLARWLHILPISYEDWARLGGFKFISTGKSKYLLALVIVYDGSGDGMPAPGRAKVCATRSSIHITLPTLMRLFKLAAPDGSRLGLLYSSGVIEEGIVMLLVTK